MSRYSLMACLSVAVLVAPGVRAQGDPVTAAFRMVTVPTSKALLASAEEMPADKFGYKPTPAQLSFGELAVHIVQDSRITCSAIAGVKPAEEKVATTDSKEKIVAALRSTLSFCDNAIAGVTDAKLTDMVTYYGSSTPRVHALVGIVDDWADHYSQQAIYLRLNGLLPPTAKKSSN